MLRGMRRSTFYWLGQLCLVALLLVPVFFSAHHHAAPNESSNCAVCVAVHHGPATVTTTIALDAPRIAIPIVPITVDIDIACARVQQFGRGPPVAPFLPTV